MHILIIPSWYINSINPLSGIFFKEQAEAIAKNPNNKVNIITVQDINMKLFIKKNKALWKINQYKENNINIYSVEYITIPKLVALRYKLKLLIFKYVFKQYIKENGSPDVIHLHSFFAGEYAMWIKKKYNIPYIITEHSSKFIRNQLLSYESKLAKKVFSFANERIAVSKEFVYFLNKQYNLSFTYIPNIVDTDFFKPIDYYKSKSKFTFINIAFLDKNKNQDMLIKAFYNVFKNNKDVELLIVGNGIEYNNLKKLTDKLNIENSVKLYGRANREEIRELLQKSDVFVLSSQFETFGIVILEAMSCALPVIATKCGGPESIVINDRLGYLSEINEKDLGDLMFKMYKNINNFDSKYIRKYVIDNFSKEAVSKKIMEIYSKAIN